MFTTGASVWLFYYNYRNGYITKERFSLEVGLAVAPALGAQFANPITRNLINVGEHQYGVMTAVHGFVKGPEEREEEK